MLREVLREIESAQGPLNLAELARKLGVEAGALEGMIEFWIRKGKIRDDSLIVDRDGELCLSANCGNLCPGPTDCPFVITMPRTYSLAEPDES